MMRRTLGAALAFALSLGLSAAGALAGDDYDYYAGADLYLARAHAPVYDCPRPGCQTNIRLRRGSYIYASCWDGYEGWCQVRTRYFKNMFLPRYALDSAYGGYHSHNYHDGSYSYDDCYYKESYPYQYGGSRTGCYDSYDGGYKGGGYGHRYGSYKYSGYAYGYRRGHSRHGGYDRDDYSGDGHGDGYDHDD